MLAVEGRGKRAKEEFAAVGHAEMWSRPGFAASVIAATWLADSHL